MAETSQFPLTAGTNPIKITKLLHSNTLHRLRKSEYRLHTPSGELEHGVQPASGSDNLSPYLTVETWWDT